jgi:hypothetical protein
MSDCTLNVNVTRNGDSITVDVTMDAPGLELPNQPIQYIGNTIVIDYFFDATGPVTDHIPSIPINGTNEVEVNVKDKKTGEKKCTIKKVF